MNQSPDIDNLRQRAELIKAKHQDQLLNQAYPDITKMTGDEVQALVYELQVHQIELEMQNNELKSTQQELSKSQQDYARIYNLAPVAYLSLSQLGTILQANLAATTLLNTPLCGLLGQRLEKFIHIDDQDNYYLFFHKLLKDPSSPHLLSGITIANKSTHQLDCQGLDIFHCLHEECPTDRALTYLELKAVVDKQENNEVIVYLALKDVSTHKILEDTLACLNNKQLNVIKNQRTSLTQHRQLINDKTSELQQSHRTSTELKDISTHIFNASSEGIVMIDQLGTIESSNPATSLILGYSEIELLGTAFNELLITPLFTDLSVELLSENSQSSSFRVDGLHSNGSILPLSLSLVNFTLNQTSHFAIVIRDNSLRLQQEQYEKNHLDEIAHMTRLSLIGSMGSGIAHQVNQPLTSISNYTQACLHLIKAEQPNLNKLSEVLTKTYDQAQKAGRIIHRMKDLASQRSTLRSMNSIDALIESAVNFCADECYQHNITMTLDLTPDSPVIALDSVQIEQVILNLIRNAIDALKEQKNAKDRRISIQTQLKEDLEVRVKDNGPGLTKVQKEKILTPFFTSKPSGMGMGLSICRSILEAHGGMIRFDSKLEVGTTFYFNLPLNGEKP
ncbi:MAG: ATP-binding protein [Methylococcales bacterium]